MTNVIIRHVNEHDVDACYTIESICYTTDAATREKIQKRIELDPDGFLVAELKGQIVGMINSGSTNRDDITDEAFKDMVGHEKNGKNIVIFSLAVLPEYQGNGVSKKLMSRFIEVSKALKKQKILLICKSNLVPYYQKYGFSTVESQHQHLAALSGMRCICLCIICQRIKQKILFEPNLPLLSSIIAFYSIYSC